MRNEEEVEETKKWCFRANEKINKASEFSIRRVLTTLVSSVDEADTRPTIPLGHGDPSVFPIFRTTPVAEEAICDSVRSANFNSYSPAAGILPARSAVAEYLSRDLPYKLSPDDVFLTLGCKQAIETALSVLAVPGANILIPRPGFPHYEAHAWFCDIEVRQFDLLPDKNWEVDLDAVEALADQNTVGIVMINPGNPCGNVFTYQHLKKVAETARRLGILVIADEVYNHLTFGDNPFVPMGVFGSIVPVLTVGSISKRWIVPGWRLGWLVVTDPNGVLKKTKIVDCIRACINISSDPASFIQGAPVNLIGTFCVHYPLLSSLLEIVLTSRLLVTRFNPRPSNKEQLLKSLRIQKRISSTKLCHVLRQCADICHDEIKEINCITCPHKPEGSMFVMVKLNLSLMEGICDDMDFCIKLAKEESVIVLPGAVLGLKNWLRITFAIDPSSLKDGMDRIKSFCQRHAKQR